VVAVAVVVAALVAAVAAVAVADRIWVQWVLTEAKLRFCVSTCSYG